MRKLFVMSRLYNVTRLVRGARCHLCIGRAAWLIIILVTANGCLTAADQPGKTIELSGCRIDFKDRVILAADRAGTLAFVEPEEGDQVKAEQLVAGLRDAVAQAVLERAGRQASNDVEIRYAEKASEVAAVEYEKALDANNRVQGAVSNMELRRLKLAAERAVLQIEQAENQFEISQLDKDQAEAELETFQIVAPFDGVVKQVFKSRGEAVRQGDPVLELVNTERLLVQGDVTFEQGLLIKKGAAVEVMLDIPGAELEVEQQTFTGKIVFVDVSVQPVTGLIRIKAEVINRENILRSGLNAKMVIDLDPPAAGAPSARLDTGESIR